MIEFKQFLIKHDACDEALAWLDDRNAEQAWTECPRGDWMFWLVGRVVNGTEQSKWGFVRVVLECARLYLSSISDPRTHKCCNAIERWLAGESVALEIACRSAYAAVTTLPSSAASLSIWTAKSAASSAIWAAKSAASSAIWAAKAVATENAAERAIWTAWAVLELAEASDVSDAGYAIAARQLECADIVRNHITWAVIGPFIQQKLQGNNNVQRIFNQT